jgi:DNA-binding transcriptional ArsR family regulator
MSTSEIQDLVEDTRREIARALRYARLVAVELNDAVEESDRRVEPVVKRLREAGLLKR